MNASINPLLMAARGVLLAVGVGCVAEVGERTAEVGERTAELDGMLREAAAIQVATAPRQVIGGKDDEDSFRLFGVSDAVLLPNGQLVVANAGEYQLLVFDAQGRLVRRLGNQGEGPGEFSAGLTPRLFVTRDALLATSGVGRVNRYALPSLELTATQRLVRGGSPTREALVGAFSDGSLLLASYPIGPPDSTRVPELRQPSINLFRLEEIGDSGVRVATVREVARYTHNSGPITSNPPIPVFGRDIFAVSDSSLVVVPTDSGTIRFVGADGALQRVLRWNVDQVPAREAWRNYAAGAARRSADLPPPIRAHELSFFDREIPLPEMAALYRTVRVDATGAVWLGHANWTATSSNSWDVVDPNRRTRSRVELPPGVRPYVVGEHVLVGLVADSLGVERIVIHDLRREH